jgi:acyl carrier protein
MSVDTTSPAMVDGTVDEGSVLADITGMLQILLEEYGLDEAEITMGTKFHDDLELESIDLVGLSGQLRDRYGDAINFAAFIAERELGEIMALTVGELVEFVVESLRAPGRD